MRNLLFALFLCWVTGCGTTTCEIHYPEKAFVPVKGLQAFNSLAHGVANAQRCHKPILIWFTGYAAVSSRKMEEQFMSQGKIFPLIKEEYVVVCLPVDDKTPLPKDLCSEWEFNGKVREIKTVGQLNSKLQVTRYQNNTQPFFVLTEPDGKTVLGEFSYETGAEAANILLKSAVEKFKHNESVSGN